MNSYGLQSLEKLISWSFGVNREFIIDLQLQAKELSNEELDRQLKQSIERNTELITNVLLLERTFRSEIRND